MSSIITFYSYKGGVGRSMALANVAVLLAQKGLRVLMVDWDLEAPGLERYFSYFPIDAHGDGILHLLVNVASGLTVDYKQYVCNINVGDSHSISFLPSGREQNLNYSTELSDFDWDGFFRNSGGGNFLENLRKQWLADFDIVLIDSRTGLTDAGGICTILLPDIVVAMFTANYQSLYGVRDVLQLAQQARQTLAYDRMPLTILPVPSRFGMRAEFEVSQRWLDLFQDTLKEFYADWLPSDLEPKLVLQQVKIPQIDYFGFGEKLAVVEQGISDPEGMGFVYNKIADFLANDFSDVRVLLGAGERKPEPAEVKSGPAPTEDYSYDIYFSYGGNQVFDLALEMARNLSELLDLEFRNFSFFIDATEVRSGSDFRQQNREALKRSKLLIAIVTPAYFANVNALIEWQTFVNRSRLTGSQLVVPLVLRGEGRLPEWFKTYQYMNWDPLPIAGSQSRRSKEYRSSINQLSKVVAELLPQVPPFDKDWPVASPEDVKELLVTPSVRRTYTVKPGDTLTSIAIRYGATAASIAAQNNLQNINKLSVGQVLVIPDQ